MATPIDLGDLDWTSELMQVQEQQPQEPMQVQGHQPQEPTQFQGQQPYEPVQGPAKPQTQKPKWVAPVGPVLLKKVEGENVSLPFQQ
jgi:hypothetical protein